MSLLKKAKKNKTILANYSYLSLLKGFEIAFPLITYPYLIRIVGAENYGVVTFARNFIVYLSVIINFGFGLSITRDISLHRDDRKKVSEIVSSVYIIKMGFFILSFFILMIMIASIEKVNDYKSLYYIAYFVMVREVFFPAWYFQGIEKMGNITMIRVLTKTISLALIFIFVKEVSHFPRILIIDLADGILTSIISLYIVFYRDKIRFYFTGIHTLAKYLKEGFDFFLSSVTNIYMGRLNIMIIGFFINYETVAYYNLAQRIVKLLNSIFSLFRDAIYPKLSKDKNIKSIMRTIIFSVLGSVIVYLGLIFFGWIPIKILGGNEMLETLRVLKYMGINTVFNTLTIMSGIGLAVFNKTKKYRNSLFFSSIIYLFALLIAHFTTSINIISLTVCYSISLMSQSLYRLYYFLQLRKSLQG